MADQEARRQKRSSLHQSYTARKRQESHKLEVQDQRGEASRDVPDGPTQSESDEDAEGETDEEVFTSGDLRRVVSRKVPWSFESNSS